MQVKRWSPAGLVDEPARPATEPITSDPLPVPAEFVSSLDTGQRAFLLALEAGREARWQSAMTAACQIVSTIGQPLSEATLQRLTLASGP